jgi:hypothetical protein
LLACALPVLACSPAQSVDRSQAKLGIGGTMRPTDPAPGKSDETPKSSTTSVEQPTVMPGTAADAGTASGGETSQADAGTAPTTPAPTSQPEPAVDAGTNAAVDTAPEVPLPDPNLSSPPAKSCDKAPAWTPGGVYLGGESITHGTPKRKFECRPWPYAPWCALESYEPGAPGSFWIDAWIDRGLCP